MIQRRKDKADNLCALFRECLQLFFFLLVCFFPSLRPLRLRKIELLFPCLFHLIGAFLHAGEINKEKQTNISWDNLLPLL